MPRKNHYPALSRAATRWGFVVLRWVAVDGTHCQGTSQAKRKAEYAVLLARLSPPGNVPHEGKHPRRVRA